MLNKFRRDKEKIQPPLRFNLSHLSRLNKLNSVLKKKQTEIWIAIDQQVSDLEAQLIKENTTLSNYELKLGIQYYVMKNSHPIHSSCLTINLVTRREMAKQMNDPSFDWWAKGMPILEQPYCFLLSQLFEQWHIAHRIPDIAMVWTTIQVEYQSSMLLKNNKWTFVTKYDEEI